MNNLSDSRDCAFKAFITNLGKYNEGELVGEWVKFPITNDEMQEAFKRIGIGRRYEEWFITDYECPEPGIYDTLGEYESLSELNYLAGQMLDLDENEEFWQAVLELGEYTDSVQDLINLTENMDCFDYFRVLPMILTSVIIGLKKAAAMIQRQWAFFQTISTMRALAEIFGLTKSDSLPITVMSGSTKAASLKFTTATLKTYPKNTVFKARMFIPAPYPLKPK